MPPAVCAPSSLCSSSVMPPVFPLALSWQAFTILHTYMYTYRIDDVLESLLLLPPMFLLSLASPPSQYVLSMLTATLTTPYMRQALSTHLLAASGMSLAAPLVYTGHMKELWQDMVALGVNDPMLWGAVDIA
ncbi:hypothetical protein DFH08DRAFT_964544 [Mycena albidolilacea]|uniref:Uncharacterized protein n=1 Tax=Mycena albidolilacea TaxID=1033008 RepID=A0AAD6ZT32_9AGAR|nr:hypothetical protein DFH08DRAFT_964544 [Mycena albidolilacea]